MSKPAQFLPVPEPSWYAVALRSRFEKRTHLALVAEGMESFLPMVEEIHLWSDRKKKVIEPLFRGYLFVRTDLRDRIEILQTPGVVDFVCTNGKPSAIPEAQIDWVRRVTSHPKKISRATYLNAGERVRIIRGPFAGIEGIVSRLKGSTRVVLVLDAIMQAVSIEVDEWMVEELTYGRTESLSSLQATRV